MTAHPTQPVEWDGQGVTRFKQKDWAQFQQLTGYSVSGWSGLSYVSTAAYRKAAAREATLLARQPKDPGTATWYRPEYPLPHERGEHERQLTALRERVAEQAKTIEAMADALAKARATAAEVGS